MKLLSSIQYDVTSTLSITHHYHFQNQFFQTQIHYWTQNTFVIHLKNDLAPCNKDKSGNKCASRPTDVVRGARESAWRRKVPEGETKGGAAGAEGIRTDLLTWSWNFLRICRRGWDPVRPIRILWRVGVSMIQADRCWNFMGTFVLAIRWGSGRGEID